MSGFSLRVVRADDLLILEFEFFNLRLDTSTPGIPQLVRVSPNDEARIVVHFQPQHVSEETFDENFGPPATSDRMRSFIGMQLGVHLVRSMVVCTRVRRVTRSRRVARAGAVVVVVTVATSGAARVTGNGRARVPTAAATAMAAGAVAPVVTAAVVVLVVRRVRRVARGVAGTRLRSRV